MSGSPGVFMARGVHEECHLSLICTNTRGGMNQRGPRAVVALRQVEKGAPPLRI